MKIDSNIYNRFYSRWRHFEKLPKYDLNIPWIGPDGPYLSEQEIINKEYKESKKRWISSKDFQRVFGKKASNESANFIPNYVSLDPSEPPMLHKFR